MTTENSPSKPFAAAIVLTAIIAAIFIASATESTEHRLDRMTDEEMVKVNARADREYDRIMDKASKDADRMMSNFNSN